MNVYIELTERKSPEEVAAGIALTGAGGRAWSDAAARPAECAHGIVLSASRRCRLRGRRAERCALWRIVDSESTGAGAIFGRALRAVDINRDARNKVWPQRIGEPGYGTRAQHGNRIDRRRGLVMINGVEGPMPEHRSRQPVSFEWRWRIIHKRGSKRLPDIEIGTGVVH